VGEPGVQAAALDRGIHGYGVQDFLDVDPRFGTREDLRDLVATAHAHGIYVILDVILNHAGPVFSYDADRYPATTAWTALGRPALPGRRWATRAAADPAWAQPVADAMPPCGRANCKTRRASPAWAE